MPKPRRSEQPNGRYLSEVVAANVRAYRVLRKMTQTDLARRVASFELADERWDQTMVSKIERGDRNVVIDELPPLALVLGVTLAQLFDPGGPDGTRDECLDFCAPEGLLPPRLGAQWAYGDTAITMTRGPEDHPSFKIEPAPAPWWERER